MQICEAIGASLEVEVEVEVEVEMEVEVADNIPVASLRESIRAAAMAVEAIRVVS